MTCPCCERNARLETSSEYDDRTGDSLSGDVALASRDIMIERCRENVDGIRAAQNRDGRPYLRAIRGGGMGSERLAPLSEIERSAELAGKAAGFALKLMRLTRDLQMGWEISPEKIAAIHDEAEAYLNDATSMFRTPVVAVAHFKQAAE